MKKYKDKGREKIEKDGLTAAKVRALDYKGVAALCDVPLGLGDSSPADFHYENVRRDLANEVEEAFEKEKKVKWKADLQAAVDAIAGMQGMTVAENAEGNLEIK